MAPYRKFEKSDILINRIKTYPEVEFLIYDRKVYYNNKGVVSGAFTSNVGHTQPGYISLYEENIDRPAGKLIYPYVKKDSTLTSFYSVSDSDFNSNFAYGDVISSSYPYTASISVDKIGVNEARLKINALKNILDDYQKLSPHFSYTSNRYGDKSTQKLNLINVPSIFYGSSIKKGSVDLSFYVTGTLIGRLQDIKQNGELIQTLPYGSNYSGSVAGVCLYNEGMMILTGAWNIISEHTEVYDSGLSATYPRWYHFASTGSSSPGENISNSSFIMKFEGVNYINTLTMFCHANAGEVNNSNNPTWKSYGQSVDPTTSSLQYVEKNDIMIKNITKSPFTGDSGSFEKTVFINKVVIYDENKRAIAIAQLAVPKRKRESESLTIKASTDLF